VTGTTRGGETIDSLELNLKLTSKMVFMPREEVENAIISNLSLKEGGKEFEMDLN
jgi:hypothetical protein